MNAASAGNEEDCILTEAAPGGLNSKLLIYVLPIGSRDWRNLEEGGNETL